MSDHVPHTWKGKALAFLAILLAASTPALVIGYVWSHRLDTETRELTAERIAANAVLARSLAKDTCDRGNVTRAIIRRNTYVLHELAHGDHAQEPTPELARALRLADTNSRRVTRLLPIINCEATARTGVRIRLTPFADRAYMRAVAAGDVPTVANGRVVP